MHLSAETSPDQLFRPLLAAALERGVAWTPEAGGSTGGSNGNSSNGSNGNGSNGNGSSSNGNGGVGLMDNYGERALLAEEVLVYQRAASRLSELTGCR